ncbi:hypothetical protein DPMN_100278 [Dreissena polymorpha]|uniref:Uncharacterized protein n=1 Tax=Dreissena polymorpha TaxID=45954 RepID=A0A9D4LHX8_DREPO|nr:hypothetical protein DPMN_100278 [Dreissena polymorpha]
MFLPPNPIDMETNTERGITGSLPPGRKGSTYPRTLAPVAITPVVEYFTNLTPFM